MSTGKDKPPGPIRRAVFQDVPHILDSLWRRAEFVTNRIGQVDLAKKHELEVRAPWLSGAFALYVLVCAFTVFGPTLDAMCTVDSTAFANLFRNVFGWILCLGSFALFLVTLNATTSRLARKGEILARLARRREKAPADADEERKSGWSIFGNLRRLFVALCSLKWPDRIALLAALSVLFFGTVLLISPLAVSGGALITVTVDAQSCVQSANLPLVMAQGAALLILIVGGALFWQLWGKRSSLAVFCVSLALLVLVIGGLWFSSTARSEAAGGFYPHVYVILIATLLLIALLARPYAWWMFRNYSPDAARRFQNALNSVDLLHSPRDAPDISGLQLWSALVNGVSGHLLHFLLLPAFVVFIAPADWLYWLTFGFAIASLVLLVYGSLSSRWEQMLVYIDRWFLIGTPLVISIMVIVIAVLRLMGVTYVSTVIDAAPTGVLFFIVIMLYVAVWFLEYWINRWLGEELLAIVGGRTQAKLGFVPCPYAPEKPPARVQVDGRYIALHGTGRLCAHGWYEGGLKPVGGEPVKGVSFTTYGFAELFTVLGANAPNGADLAQEIRRRLALYFNVLNFVLIVSMILLIAWHLNWSRPLTVEPMVTVKAANPVPLSELTRQAPTAPAADPLADRLVAQASASRPSLVVAASGGGTRAAVYTAVALEGIAQLDRARDVVLLSGVSGGGVSAAVFASRYPALTTSQPGKPAAGARDPWADYVDTMSEPFIQDVLEGVGELRIVGPTSLGALLQESLERRAFNVGPQNISDLQAPGLILNTAISGHPYDDSELLLGRVSSPPTGAPCVQQARPYANLAGGRLIFTNLLNTSGFPQRSKDAPDLWLPYRIINYDAVPLSAAAALTANFPPVFSNARVRINPSDAAKAEGACPQSYFVTDGGATENLGLVSALYALRGTLQRLVECTDENCGAISDIHILALEASAIDYDYSDDRGLGAATGGAKERINAGLTQRLIEDVRTRTEALHARLFVHYLPLPVAFRSRGGFGTHWMFPPTLSVANPHLPEQPDNSILPWVTPRDQAILDRKEVKLTLRAMFDRDDPICTRSDRVASDPANPANKKYYDAGWSVPVQRVARWICGHDDKGRADAPKPDYQVDAWKNVVETLTPRP